MLNSRRDDLTSPDRYFDLSRPLFIRAVTKRQQYKINWPSSAYEASWSKMVRLRKVTGKCKYYKIMLEVTY